MLASFSFVLANKLLYVLLRKTDRYLGQHTP